jgi:hypothetical protein
MARDYEDLLGCSSVIILLIGIYAFTSSVKVGLIFLGIWILLIIIGFSIEKYNSWKKRNAVCSHGVKGGLAQRQCNICIQEQEEKVEQIRIEQVKEDIKRKATVFKDTEIERLRYLMIRTNEQSLFSLSPRDFEEAIADLYKKLGYSVKLTPYTDDHGYRYYSLQKYD